jgi:hypothetical protein
LLQEQLDLRPAAGRQGANRPARVREMLRQMRGLSAERQWPLQWTARKVPDVGHSANAMFASREALEALQDR